MDLIDNLLDVKKPLHIIKVPIGQVDGRTIIEDSDEEQDDNCFYQAEESAEYAAIYRKKEEQLYRTMTSEKDLNQIGSLSTVENCDDLLSTISKTEIELLRDEELKQVFTKYNFDKQNATGLPVDAYRDEILSLIQTNEVVIIHGPTGCGKTTQIPQFILNNCKAKNKSCKIVVTQPRKIAAITVARRVCEERGWALGTICGYQVALELELTHDTILQYVTTGVLLQKLIKQKTLHEYSHILIDEVHERNQDMDFLLLVIRRFLNTNSPNTRIILMSATFDAEEFAHYFKTFRYSDEIAAPIVFIEKESKYKTQVFYSDQLKVIGEIPIYDRNEPKIEPCLLDLFVCLVRAFDKLDSIDPITNTCTIGNVLVFLPGLLEIEHAHEWLVKNEHKWENTDIAWYILPLHSSITTEEQRRVFYSPPAGHRKIILSTNIAESSITVSDIVYVVDFCLTKTMILDSNTQYQCLQLQWASHTNCLQRAGRVGRVSDGRVYRLVTRAFYENDMLSTQLPEILRAPLDHLVLSTKLLELDEPPKAILALTMNPPVLRNIESTILRLKEIGALAMTCSGQKMVNDGDITFLGRVAASLPLDVTLSKLILLGYMFSCLEQAIIMATGCAINVFKAPYRERVKAYNDRLLWADGSYSDFTAYLNLYQVWQKQKRSNKSNVIEKEWCKRNLVDYKAVREWNILIREIKSRLDKMHILQSITPENMMLGYKESALLIKIAVCGAFYPNYFNRSCDGGQVDEREAVKTLGGRNPFNTVYYTGFDVRQPGRLYIKSIKDILKDCSSNMNVSFDGSSKVYVEFLTSNPMRSTKMNDKEGFGMPGNIHFEVYRSVKLRQLKTVNKLTLLNHKDAWDLAKKLGIDSITPKYMVMQTENDGNENGVETTTILNCPVLPSLDMQYITICISERINAGHFWAHNTVSNTQYILQKLKSVLNNDQVEHKVVEPRNITLGSLYIAKYEADVMFYRCKVISVYSDKEVKVIFIDYGNTFVVKYNELYVLPDDPILKTMPQAIECYLSEVQPSLVLNPSGLWSDKANEEFYRITQNNLYGKIYSVVNQIVRLQLFEIPKGKDTLPLNYTFENSINSLLIKKGYAQPLEESFLSKESYLKRKNCAENPECGACLIENTNSVNDIEVELPQHKPNSIEISLKGPFSPLEMQIYGVTESGSEKQIHVEGGSVNSVLLDANPQDPFERLVVAAQVNQTVCGNSLILRHTALMPNICGFPMLMTLLFCPTMEPKPTIDGSRFGAILCGLGAHENTHRSIYAAHDICLTLDTDLTIQDINQINELRHWMNMAIHTMESNYNETTIGMHISDCQKQLHSRLFKLLQVPRKYINRDYLKHSHVWGKTLFDAEALQPGTVGDLVEIWPLHWTLKLNKDVEQQAVMKQHIQDLEEVALRMKPANEIVCHLCNQKFYSAGEVRIHLTSSQHQESAKSYEQSKRFNFRV